MNIPKWFWIIIVILLLLGIGGFAFSFTELSSRFEILEKVGNLSLVLTLVAVLFYVYYTYKLAKEAWTPSASFILKPFPNNKYHFAFLIQNHSKIPLNCWCKLNATVNGKTISLEGFYGGQSSFDVQPLTTVMGHFNIEDNILKPGGYDLQSIKHDTDKKNFKNQLYLDIDFWYNPIGKTKEIHRNPKQPHYFDFKSDLLIADF